MQDKDQNSQNFNTEDVISFANRFRNVFLDSLNIGVGVYRIEKRIEKLKDLVCEWGRPQAKTAPVILSSGEKNHTLSIQNASVLMQHKEKKEKIKEFLRTIRFPNSSDSEQFKNRSLDNNKHIRNNLPKTKTAVNTALASDDANFCVNYFNNEENQ